MRRLYHIYAQCLHRNSVQLYLLCLCTHLHWTSEVCLVSQQCHHLSTQNVAEPVKNQWQVFIIQFITTLTITFNCICKLCSLLLLSVHTDQNHFHPDCHKHHRQRIDHCRGTHLPPSFLYLTSSLEMDKFCALDTFPHSGSGQAWLIKALCGLSKHSSGPITLARGNWLADHVTDGRGFQRQNRCSGWPEGRECLCLPALAVLRNEGKDALNRCSGFQGWKS